MPFPKRNIDLDTARRTIRDAFTDFEKAISPSDSKALEGTTLEAVQKAALDVENLLASRKSLRNLRRLQPLFDGLGHYSKAIEVACNGTPYLPWLWAPIKLILKISSDHLEAFEKLIKAYASIGQCLTRFTILSNTFQDKAPLQQTLAIFYANILAFHKQAYVFVRRSSWRLFSLTSWGRFERKFKNILEDLKDHGDLVDKEANVHHISEAREARQQLEQQRQEKLAKFARDERSRAARQLQELSTWLRIDLRDQASILDKIIDEGSHHPGTCSWALKNSLISSWLQSSREVTWLWLNGNPGSGKSIITGQLVSFLRASKHSSVVTHFCTYSYASSTQYEQILQSIIFQLSQQSDDLIEHIHTKYVISKKTSNLRAYESLLLEASTAVFGLPGQDKAIHFVLDGLDELEPGYQKKLLGLLSKLMSLAKGQAITCKMLISSRTSPVLEQTLRKKPVVSLSDDEEMKQLGMGIRIYARQRLDAISNRLNQLRVDETAVNDICQQIAEKADGMFLWARLVLDYLCTNLFENFGEFVRAINTLPRKLSDFYERILANIIANFDRRSIERLAKILGWIAYAKRPLTRAELRSAITFGSGEPNIEEAMPLYYFDLCAPLVDQRRDSYLSFIHVSVRDYLASENSKVTIIEKSTLRDHAIASITCLLSGWDVFSPQYPEAKRQLRTLKGIHSFQLYANEYWLGYIESLSTGVCLEQQHPLLHSLLENLSAKIEGANAYSEADGVRITSNCPHPPDLLREFQGLFDAAKDLLASRTHAATTLEAPVSAPRMDLQPVTTLSQVLSNYQVTVRTLLSILSFPDITQEELNAYKRDHCTTAFTCYLPLCPRASIGFETEDLRDQHVACHEPRLQCSRPGCQYPSFVSFRALRRHEAKCLDTRQPSHRIRKVRGSSQIRNSMYSAQSHKEPSLSLQNTVLLGVELPSVVLKPLQLLTDASMTNLLCNLSTISSSDYFFYSAVDLELISRAAPRFPPDLPLIHIAGSTTHEDCLTLAARMSGMVLVPDRLFLSAALEQCIPIAAWNKVVQIHGDVINWFYIVIAYLATTTPHELQFSQWLDRINE